MKKSFYSVESLEAQIGEFERRYGVASEDFYSDYLADRVPDSVARFDQSVWADAYEELGRLTGSTEEGGSSRPRHPSALQPAR